MEPNWRGRLPFPSGFILPFLGSARLSESIYGLGEGVVGGTKGTQTRKGFWVRGGLGGNWGWEEGCLTAPELPG